MAVSLVVVYSSAFAARVNAFVPPVNLRITEYPVSALASLQDLQGLAAGPDGAVWFSKTTSNSIGRITIDGVVTEYPLPSAICGASRCQPNQLTVGADGALWFSGSHSIGRVAITGPSIGALTLFNVSGYASSITLGPDGALWFVEHTIGGVVGNNAIGRITTAGSISEYRETHNPGCVTSGPDGALWFTGENWIGRITTGGAISGYSVSGTNGVGIHAITSGPDGALWFLAQNAIGRITTSGAVTEYAYNGPGLINTTGVGAITTGPDGALWFTIENTLLGRVTTSGFITTYPAPESLGPITIGPDGNLWFADYNVEGDPLATPRPRPGLIKAQVLGALALPQLAIGAGFITGFFIVNGGNDTASFTISFFNDNGVETPAPLTFEGVPHGAATNISGTVPSHGTQYWEAGTADGQPVTGSAIIAAEPSITIQAFMRRRGGDGSYYEAAIPATSGSYEFQTAFDATVFPANGAQIYTGIAISNLDPFTTANVTCTARDSRGIEIPNAVNVPPLYGVGHWADYLFPALNGKRGTLDCSSNTKVAALAVRALGANAISLLPVIPVR
jgi:virginiamycin B lyase